MDKEEAINLIENAILDTKIHANDETITCVDCVNIEALELLLKIAKEN